MSLIKRRNQWPGGIPFFIHRLEELVQDVQSVTCSWVHFVREQWVNGTDVHYQRRARRLHIFSHGFTNTFLRLYNRTDQDMVSLFIYNFIMRLIIVRSRVAKGVGDNSHLLNPRQCHCNLDVRNCRHPIYRNIRPSR